jgi:hypothetical protein
LRDETSLRTQGIKEGLVGEAPPARLFVRVVGRSWWVVAKIPRINHRRSLVGVRENRTDRVDVFLSRWAFRFRSHSARSLWPTTLAVQAPPMARKWGCSRHRILLETAVSGILAFLPIPRALRNRPHESEKEKQRKIRKDH